VNLPPRHVAPAGSPIRLVDLARWVGGLATERDAAASLRAALCERFGLRAVALTSTGRAGLSVLTAGLATLAGRDRDEVIVPSYTCYSVPASIVKAGLKPRVVDIDPDTLDYDPDRLARTDFRRVAAIVATNLYGYPNDGAALEAVARSHGVLFIDDAAQAMGARLGGRAAGSRGDAGLLSFDKGKCVSAIDGGVIVLTNPAVEAAVAPQLAMLTRPATAETAGLLIKLAAYVTLLRPSLYWIPNGIPQLGLGDTRYTTEYPLAHPSRLLTVLARTMLDRLPAFAEARRVNADALAAALGELPGLSRPRPHPGAEPAYVRFPVLVRDRATQARMIAALRAAGIGATGSYPQALVDVPGLQDHLIGDPAASAGGRHVAERIVTLPTHPFVSIADRRRIVETFAQRNPSASVSAVGAEAR
jgi:dTDP-4-amino-4,6-dideoxygalactose transaminase